MQNFSKELVGASSIPIILTILSSKESYGYEIIQEIKSLSDGKLTWAEGSLYPVLHKLEKRKLIKSSWKIADTKRKRKYYKLTSLGKKELAKEKENWTFINNLILNLWNPNQSLT